ncbi:MAG: hypothetical protein IJ468_13135, partial [Lachnospiraceae bacterium]|nr:hypothetical protein [Lachnospiraceae bacterium]
MKIKRMLSALLTVVLVMGCFAGCGKENNAEAEEIALMPSISTAATGRYVEKELFLPESQYAMDMVMLSDGRLRVALQEENGNVLLCDTSLDRTLWEDPVSLPDDIINSGNVESVALSPDGTVFCNTIEKLEDETYQPHLWVIDPSGDHREIPVTYKDVDPSMGYFIAYADFTDDGRLMAQIYVQELREIDLTTGQFSENLNELAPIVSRMGCAGGDAYMMGMETVSYHHDGETMQLPDV